MTRFSIPGGWYCDALPTGPWVSLVIDSHLQTNQKRVELPNGQNLLFVRMAPDGIRFAGVGHKDNQAWEWSGSEWLVHGFAVGPRPVLYSASGQLIINHTVPDFQRTGGWRAFTNGLPVSVVDSFEDINRRIWEYTTLPNQLTIGQGGAGPDGEDPVIAILGGQRYLLSKGQCRFINVRSDLNDTISLAWVSEDAKQSEFLWLDRTELLTFPHPTVVTVPPNNPPNNPPPPIDPPKELPVKLEPSVLTVVRQFAAQYPVPSGGPNPADEAFENQCRLWTKMLAEQIAFSFPGQGFGTKNAGGGRPQSKDSLARFANGRLINYDMLGGVGTGSPTLLMDPDGVDITGQTFIPVTPINHLATVPPPVPPTQPPVPPIPPTQVVDLKPVLDAIEVLSARIEQLREKELQDLVELNKQLQTIQAQLQRGFTGSVRILGQSVRFDLSPKQ